MFTVVRYKSGTVAIDINFCFEHAVRHSKMSLIILLVGITGCIATNRNLFRRTVLQKCGRVLGIAACK